MILDHNIDTEARADVDATVAARGLPLEPSPSQARALGLAALDVAVRHVAGRPFAPAVDVDLPDELMSTLAQGPPDEGESIERVLDLVVRAAGKGFDTTGHGYLAFIPGGGLFTAAIADFLALVLNRFVASASAAPALTRIEESVIRWMCDLFRLPEGSWGVLTSGGSVAQLSALVTARCERLGERFEDGTLYVSDQAHYSIAKAARIAGFAPDAVRVVRTDTSCRLDMDHLATLVRDDRAAGRRPFFVVGTAGTTSSGAVDDLATLAGWAADQGLWFHVDAAYGGFFQLTDAGRERLRGIEQADSITVDPHKSLFLPYGTGALLVRDGRSLARAHAGAGSAYYLVEARNSTTVTNLADYSIELSREARGLRVWLPLQVHGVAAFRACLSEKLALARWFADSLAARSASGSGWLEVSRPDLSIVTFRCSPEVFADPDAATLDMLNRVNASGRAFLSSTVLDGRVTGRACILSHRVGRPRLDEVVELVLAAAPVEPA